MKRQLLALALVAVAASAAPASAYDPIPPQLRPDTGVWVDQSRPAAGVVVWVGDYPLLGARVEGDNGRACAGWGYTTGICSDQVTDRVVEIVGELIYIGDIGIDVPPVG